MTYRRRFAFPLAIALSLAGAAAFDAVAGQTEAPGRLQLADSSTQANTDKAYKIAPDGTVDWATFNGYRRFNSNCETCHGFDGEGSSFGPRLVDVLKTMPHDTFLEIVANGMQDVSTAQTLKMPALSTNPNVMCYIEDIYTYLRARADGALGRGRPAKHEPKPKSAADAENACMPS
jgi:methanol metabolism-related c-type cytochrome